MGKADVWGEGGGVQLSLERKSFPPVWRTTVLTTSSFLLFSARRTDKGAIWECVWERKRWYMADAYALGTGNAMFIRTHPSADMYLHVYMYCYPCTCHGFVMHALAVIHILM